MLCVEIDFPVGQIYVHLWIFLSFLSSSETYELLFWESFAVKDLLSIYNNSEYSFEYMSLK